MVVDGCNEEAAEKMLSPDAEQTQLDLSRCGWGCFLPFRYPSLQAASEVLAYASVDTERTGRKDFKKPLT